MRRTTVLALAAAALLLAGATPVLALPFTGTLTIQYASALLPSISMAGGGTSVDGPAGAFALAPGGFAGDAGPVDVSDGAPFVLVIELQDVASGAGSFAGGSGSMAVNGELLHYFFQTDPGQAIPISLADVGVGGTSPISVVLGTGPVTGSVTGSTWTTGAISVVGVNTLNASGFDNRALDGSGAIRFVTPIDVVLTIGPTVMVPAYAQLDLVFAAPTPEPGTLGLVGVALAMLIPLRRARSA